MRLPVIRLRSPFANRRWRVCAYIALALILIPVAVPLVATTWVRAAAGGRIYDTVDAIPSAHVALVLGAGVGPDGQLSVHLRDRVDAAVELYKAHKASKLLMSGDNRFINYNEPDAMRQYAIKCGVPAENVVCDYAGRRTYDSMYRARHIFGITRMIVVSQRFHLYRAIFLCEHVGIDAVGLAADRPGHRNARIEAREFPACVLSMLDVYLLRPQPVMGKRETI